MHSFYSDHDRTFVLYTDSRYKRSAFAAVKGMLHRAIGHANNYGLHSLVRVCEQLPDSGVAFPLKLVAPGDARRRKDLQFSGLLTAAPGSAASGHIEFSNIEGFTMTTRRRFLAANLMAAAGFGSGLTGRSFAQSEDVGQGGQNAAASRTGVDFWNDWADQLTRAMNRSRDARMGTLAQIRSQSQAQARVETIRTQLWQLLGGQLERGDLNAKVTGSVQGSGFHIEKLLYESLPGVVVTANLYLPDAGSPPYPAILAPLGHSGNGKAYKPYQHLFQTLAHLGYVVLAYDPWGQGERLQYINPKTGRSFMEPTGEHDMAGRPMVLLGQSLAQYLTWDGIRGVDYLLTRPEVDPKRIGCTGQSGGGTMTMYLAALEPRIAAAVVNEGNTENVAGPQYDPPGAVDDAEQNVPGSLPLHLDRGDILAATAPRPLLICYTTHDRGVTYSPVYDVASEDR